MKLFNTVLIWVGAFALTLLLFYGIDQFIMAAQGLPLNWDMTPAQ
jgi:hypothetical protein